MQAPIIPWYVVANTVSQFIVTLQRMVAQMTVNGKREKRNRDRNQWVYLNVFFEIADWYDQAIQTSKA